MQAVDIQGKEIRFETFKKNKLLLIVNVASKWGLTKEQYQQIGKLHEMYK